MSSEFLQPPGWAAPKGYSNGVSASGRQIYLAGQIGWNESQQLVSSRFAVQVRQALQNIIVLLAQAGGRPEHLVRLTWFVTNLDEYRAEVKEIGAAYRDVDRPALSADVGHAGRRASGAGREGGDRSDGRHTGVAASSSLSSARAVRAVPSSERRCRTAWT